MPARQRWHDDAPEAFWKKPAWQLVHSLLRTSGAKKPGLHFLGAMLAIEHACPRGQSVHSPTLPTCDRFEKVPWTHGSGAAADASQYEPGGQPMQLV